MTEIFARINDLLDNYFIKSRNMIEKGYPWAVVISFHEVFRHLFPTEPHIKDYQVTDENRPKYILNLLHNQMKMYLNIEDAVIPYDNVFVKSDNNDSLEKYTHTLYGGLWKDFNMKDIVDESKTLLERRINTPEFKLSELKGKTVFDMGCGSGRYTIALASYGCEYVTGCDIGAQGLVVGSKVARKLGLKNIFFEVGNVLDLKYVDGSFDFIFCNGVLHHTSNMEKGLSELYRVLKPNGKAFLYLYGSGGVHWKFRRMAKEVMRSVPSDYAKSVLRCIGLPSNRFIFIDAWYVPIEIHTNRKDLEQLLRDVGFSRFDKLVGSNPTDLETLVEGDKLFAREMFGDGEHRYLLFK